MSLEMKNVDSLKIVHTVSTKDYAYDISVMREKIPMFLHLSYINGEFSNIRLCVDDGPLFTHVAIKYINVASITSNWYLMINGKDYLIKQDKGVDLVEYIRENFPPSWSTWILRTCYRKSENKQSFGLFSNDCFDIHIRARRDGFLSIYEIKVFLDGKFVITLRNYKATSAFNAHMKSTIQYLYKFLNEMLSEKKYQLSLKKKSLSLLKKYTSSDTANLVVEYLNIYTKN